VGLAGLLLVVAVVQIAVLRQIPLVNAKDDSFSYLGVAQNILSAQGFFNAHRTPGYPAFLALIMLVFGSQRLEPIIIVQILLMVVTALELYVLAYRLSGNVWVAWIAAVLVGANFYPLNWARVIRVEALTYWSLVTLLLVFERVVRTHRARWLVAFVVLAAVGILIRPNNIYIPVALLVFLAVHDLRLRVFKRYWWRLALAGVAVYAIVLAYMAGNAAATGFFGITDVSSINLLGKVVEYDMQGETNNPRYVALRDDVVAWAAAEHAQKPGSFADPHLFLKQYPQYQANHYQEVAGYSYDIILHHPLQYIGASGPDIVKAWLAPPTTHIYAPYVSSGIAMRAITTASLAVYVAFPLLPVLAIVVCVLAWRQSHNHTAFIQFALIMTALIGIIENALGASQEYARLREPLDWMALLAATLLVAQAALYIAKRLAQARVAKRLPSSRDALPESDAETLIH
jgi:hypothetical protein